MKNQISFTEYVLEANLRGELGNADTTNAVPSQEPVKVNNCHKGERHTVYPIKKMNELEAMTTWLYNNVDKKYVLAFILGINLGLRANELLGLRKRDIFTRDGSFRYSPSDGTDTTDKITVYQTKVDKHRDIYLNEACVNVLEWYYPDRASRVCSDAYLFPSREGGHICVDSLRKVLKRAAKACGVKQNVGTHTMRKTFGYNHYQTNHDVVFLQHLFGHSSSLTTMRYIGEAEEEEKAAYHGVSIDLMGAIKE